VNINEIIQITLFFGLGIALTPPVGRFMAKVYKGERTFLHPIFQPIAEDFASRAEVTLILLHAIHLNIVAPENRVYRELELEFPGTGESAPRVLSLK
jgi:hypothetical protein